MQGQQMELGVPRTNEEDLRRASRIARWETGASEEGARELRSSEDVREDIEEFWEERGEPERIDDRRDSR